MLRTRVLAVIGLCWLLAGGELGLSAADSPVEQVTKDPAALWRAYLQTEDTSERRDLSNRLSQLDPPPVQLLPSMVALLESTESIDNDTLYLIGILIARCGHAAASTASALVVALEQESRQHLVYPLRRIGDAAAVPPLRRLLAASTAGLEARCLAAALLVGMEPTSRLGELCGSEAPARLQALCRVLDADQALAKPRFPRDHRLPGRLTEWLHAGRLRPFACQAFAAPGCVAVDEAVDMAMALSYWKDLPLDWQRGICSNLAELGPVAGFPADRLVHLLVHDDQELRQAARQALTRLLPARAERLAALRPELAADKPSTRLTWALEQLERVQPPPAELHDELRILVLAPELQLPLRLQALARVSRWVPEVRLPIQVACLQLPERELRRQAGIGVWHAAVHAQKSSVKNTAPFIAPVRRHKLALWEAFAAEQDEELRARLLETISLAAEDADEDALLALVDDRQAAVGASALGGLYRLYKKSAVPAARRWHQAEGDLRQRIAQRIITNMEPNLLRDAKDRSTMLQDPDLVDSVLKSMQSRPPKAADIPIIAAMLADSTVARERQLLALKALSRCRSTGAEAVPLILPFLAVDDAELRHQAVQTLAGIRHPSAVVPMLTMLERHADMANPVLYRLVDMETQAQDLDQNVTERVLPWTAHADPMVRAPALILLGQCGDAERARVVLQEVLRTGGDGRVVVAAIKGLGYLAREDATALTKLCDLVSDKEAGELRRAQAVAALRASGRRDEQVLQVLVAVLPEAELSIARECCWLLGRWGDGIEAALPALQQVVQRREVKPYAEGVIKSIEWRLRDAERKKAKAKRAAELADAKRRKKEEQARQRAEAKARERSKAKDGSASAGKSTTEAANDF